MIFRTEIMKSPLSRVKRKIRLLKTRKEISEGKSTGGKDVDTILKFWQEEVNNTRGTVHDNTPYAYADENEERREMINYMLDKFSKYAPSHESLVLELGTSVGLLFSHLYEKGYHNLTGVEINPKSIELMSKKFPEMYKNSQILNGSFEEIVPNLPDNKFDLVYSTAVLMHLHPNSNFIFEHISRISRKYIMVLELEDNIMDRIFPRKYKKIFENLGYKQVFFEKNENKTPMYRNYHFRVFQKISK